MNKIINPLITLSTEEDIEAFLNLNQEFSEKTRFMEKKNVKLGALYKQRYAKTRSIAFIFDKEDYPDEIKNLKESGRYSARRDEMRLAMVTDKKLIKKYKAKYGSSWFPDSSYTTVILKRYDG